MNPTLSPRQRLGMCWLMLALVLTSALGLVHKVVHGPSWATPVATIQAAQTDAQSVSAEPVRDALFSLFGAHTKSECVLFDQMALGDALFAQAAPLAQPQPAAIPVVDLSAESLGQHAAPFRARGPPLLWA